MNKVILKKDGGLHINGVEVLSVTGFSVKMCDMDTSTVVVQFDTSFLEVEVGVSDFKAGATLQSEIAPRNAVIQKMMEIGLTYTEAMDALESSKTHLAKNLGTYATGNDPLSVALYPDWRG